MIILVLSSLIEHFMGSKLFITPSFSLNHFKLHNYITVVIYEINLISIKKKLTYFSAP